ncbi:prepilin peptidase [Pseudostreptobacillus hongkongensis]|uniref:prepilin peptidase n=1 Tax=Pseudostreptobacillus hongkongensis TaxID=1162717 RepID=UPI000835B7EE|nr:prepilin peptidase [Pseudostreptobacillus hongkongensis]
MVSYKIVLFIIFILISYYDFRYKIIPDRLLLLLLIICIFNFKSIESMYVGMAIYSFPLFLIWLLEVHLDKELIGLGDIKLIILLGLYKGMVTVSYLYTYFTLVCIISLIYILIIKLIGKKDKYIPFAPMLILGMIFMGL